MKRATILLALLSSGALSTPTLHAQCCEQKQAPAPTPAPKARLLFNETCPVTGLPTSADTPRVAFEGRLVSLCCEGCKPLFAKLKSGRVRAFIAKHSGKNQRSSFPTRSSSRPQETTRKRSCCTEKAPAKPSKKPAEKSCCSGKPSGKSAGKPATKPCCGTKSVVKPTKKPCCGTKSVVKPAKKPCCGTKPHAKPTKK